jgi:hypothetical protein
MSKTSYPLTPHATPLGLRPLFLCLLLLSVTACFGGGDLVLGHEAPLAGDAVLTCSQDCADRAQCGQSTDRGEVVLLSPFGPVTQGHTMAVPVDTTVQIIDRRQETAVAVLTNELATVLFYRVTIPDRAEPGWVAGWCLSGTPQQAEG